MYNFQTKSDAFLDINPLTKIVAFLVANILILGVKTYKTEIIFCMLILLLGINGKLCKQPLSADSRAAFPGQSGPY